MSDFRQLSDTVWASPQIDAADLEQASADGFTLVVNNRPDGEDAGQPDGETIAAKAAEAGMNYVAIPITHAGFSGEQVGAMEDALSGTDGKVLAYCRSGTRSTFLWALARAKAGDDPAEIAEAAAAAGYDVGPVRPAMEMFAAKQGD